MRNRIAIRALLISMLLGVGVGYASWGFSSERGASAVTTVNIRGFSFSFSWDGSDSLDADTYGYAEGFPEALNGLDDPTSERGKALSDAIAAKKSSDWLGNMDSISNVSGNLGKVLDVKEGCSYIIKIKSDGSYELYVTYEDLSAKSVYARFGPVYKTVYRKNSDGKYAAVQSCKGTATVTYYDTRHMQWQRSFNTDDFQVV